MFKLTAMSAKSIIAFLKISATVLFYFMVFITVVFLFVSLLNLSGKNIVLPSKAYSFEVMAFGIKNPDPGFTYSSDSVVGYQQVYNRYTLLVKPGSLAGYFSLITTFIFMSLGIAILWNFKKIFSELNLNNPFMETVFRRLKILAFLFVLSDGLELFNYFALNRLIGLSLKSPDFELITTTGNGIITGLIIWIFAVIYQRGIALQEDNALTV